MSIIGKDSKTDPNKILPIKYPWARQYYKDGKNNNWGPEEIPMQDDVEMWKSSDALSEHERRLIMWNLGFFSTAESLTANNIVLAIYKHVTDPACRQYMLRQAFEEAIHTDTFIYCCDTLGLDPDGVYDMYQTIPSIKEKDEFVVNITKTIFDPKFEITHHKTDGPVKSVNEANRKANSETVRAFLKDLIGYYVVMEGVFFYAGFAMMLALKRQKKMVGIGEQFEYIMRDESVHLAFGCDLINQIRQENPGVWDAEFEKEIATLISQAVILEQTYAHDACPQGLLGINADQFGTYVEFIADRRLERLGMPKQYGVLNPFPWMSQSVDLMKEKNFFETRVTEYQVGGLDWD